MRLLVCLIWAGLAIAGLYYGDQILHASKGWLDETLTPLIVGLDIVQELLVETVDVLTETGASLATVQNTTVNLTLTLTDTYPLIDDASQIITQELPTALDDIQNSMPSVIETAAAVDETLALLSGVNITIPNFFGDDLKIGLGIDYSPDIPLDQTLQELSGNLEGIPEDLRKMENDLDNASVHMITLRDDLSAVADDLYQVNQQLGNLNPQIEKLIEDIQTIHSSLEQRQARFVEALPTIRLVMIVFLSLVLLGQVPSAYVGARLLCGLNKVSHE